jgi:Domain of unknown function (DUF4440)
MIRSITRLAVLAFAPLGAVNAASNTDIAKVMITNNELLQRATREYDTATVGKLITSDFTLITSSGRVMNAQELLADVGDKSVTWLANDTEDIHVRVYNDDCAIVTAVLHQRYEYQGKMNDYRVRFTDTWVKIVGEWRYAAGHASLLKTS